LLNNGASFSLVIGEDDPLLVLSKIELEEVLTDALIASEANCDIVTGLELAEGMDIGVAIEFEVSFEFIVSTISGSL